LILYDVAFDAITALDFKRFELKVTFKSEKKLEEKETV
jgi:hypothetical protein